MMIPSPTSTWFCPNALCWVSCFGLDRDYECNAPCPKCGGRSERVGYDLWLSSMIASEILKTKTQKYSA